MARDSPSRETPSTPLAPSPPVGSSAPDIQFTLANLSDVALSSFAGVRVLNIFPSIDTGICAMSVRTFNERASSLGRRHRDQLERRSSLRTKALLRRRRTRRAWSQHPPSVAPPRKTSASPSATGPWPGLCSRAVLVIDAEGKVLHAEQVPEIVQEPNYDAALAVLG